MHNQHQIVHWLVQIKTVWSCGWSCQILHIIQRYTWLLQNNIDLLALHIASMFNFSMSFGAIPACHKDAYATPCLKKSTLPCIDLSSYWSISNLLFLSELLEQIISVQLADHLTSAYLLPGHHSAYWRGSHPLRPHSWRWSSICSRRSTWEIMHCLIFSTSRPHLMCDMLIKHLSGT